MNKINDRDKIPTEHTGAFACPNTWKTASQPKETEFFQRPNTAELKLIED